MEATEAEWMEDPSKRDTRGRRIVSEGERERLIAEYECSGMTQKAFSRREGLNYHTFVAWLGRHRRGPDEEKETGKPQFKEVSLLTAGGGRRHLEVGLPSGVVIRGDDPEALAQLVNLLRL